MVTRLPLWYPTYLRDALISVKVFLKISGLHAWIGLIGAIAPTPPTTTGDR